VISVTVIGFAACGREGSGLSARQPDEEEGVRREKVQEERVVYVMSKDVVEVEVESGDRSSTTPPGSCKGGPLD